MKRTILLGTTLALSMAFGAIAQDTGEGTVFDDPDMYGDLVDMRMQEIEMTLEKNPVLMRRIVSDTLRRDPSVIQDIIRDTLLRNPEIVVQSLQEFQRQQQTGGIKPAPQLEPAALSQDFLERVRSANDAPVRGNPAGAITIIEFSDYNCGFCRQFDPILKKLIADNPDLRVIHREWPILGEASAAVARLALAAQEQGAYEKMHIALMQSTGALDEGRALAIAAELGLDVEKLKSDAKKPAYQGHIQKTADFAREIDLAGTPAIIIGDEIARGLAGIDQIQPIIDAARVK